MVNNPKQEGLNFLLTLNNQYYGRFSRFILSGQQTSLRQTK